jgi:D-tyrosyl-tRNA(Tyr) deacylase
MIAVVQRVSEASVAVGDEVVGKIDGGLVALVAVVKDDGEVDVKWMARKLTELRIFRGVDGDKHFDLDVRSAGGALLLVSNFTVAGATRQGRRPSFDAAADAENGGAAFEELVRTVRESGVPVQTGRFRADMAVRLVNDGPVTVILDSSEARAAG